MTTKFKLLRDANTTRQKEWDSEGKITLYYRINELLGEVGETCNVLKKLHREQLGIRGSRVTLDQLAEELADIVICADLVAANHCPAINFEKQIVANVTAGNGDYSSKGIMLGKAAGDLCHYNVNRYGEDNGSAELRAALKRLVWFVAAIANESGIPLREAVVSKFNATTQKQGLSVFMEDSWC